MNNQWNLGGQLYQLALDNRPKKGKKFLTPLIDVKNDKYFYLGVYDIPRHICNCCDQTNSILHLVFKRVTATYVFYCTECLFTEGWFNPSELPLSMEKALKRVKSYKYDLMFLKEVYEKILEHYPDCVLPQRLSEKDSIMQEELVKFLIFWHEFFKDDYMKISRWCEEFEIMLLYCNSLRPRKIQERFSKFFVSGETRMKLLKDILKVKYNLDIKLFKNLRKVLNKHAKSYYKSHIKKIEEDFNVNNNERVQV